MLQLWKMSLVVRARHGLDVGDGGIGEGRREQRGLPTR